MYEVCTKTCLKKLFVGNKAYFVNQFVRHRNKYRPFSLFLLLRLQWIIDIDIFNCNVLQEKTNVTAKDKAMASAAKGSRSISSFFGKKT